MPAKKREKGKTMKITEFVDEHFAEDVYDYVDDSWMTEEQAKEAKLAEKLGQREYSRTANNALNEQESFRNTEAHETLDDMIERLEPPYVAHFGNLRNNIDEEKFLELFTSDVIKKHRIIKKDGKSFAFVEFTSPQALAVALVMDKTYTNGRQMYVNLASKKQIDRLLENDFEPGSPSQHSLGLSRNLFGSTNNLNSSMTSPVGRESFGANSSVREVGELSRDLLGTAIPDAGESPLLLDNWRSSEHENAAAESASKPRKDNLENWRSAEVTSPVTLENWRSDSKSGSPKDGRESMKLTEASWRGEGKTGARSPIEDGKPREGPWRRGDAVGTSNARTAASHPPISSAKPKGGEGDRWGSFRK